MRTWTAWNPVGIVPGMATVDNGGVSSQDLAVPLLDTHSRELKTQNHVHELSHGMMGTTQMSTD